jgi:signal transduction histidine kinase
MMMTLDAHGVPHEGERALGALHAVANAPIFGLFSFQLGHGIVGGRLLDVSEIANTTSRVALRILGGEEPGTIHTPPIQHAGPLYDWRELRRWKIHAESLPRESLVLYREPGAWEKHRWKILLGLGVIAAQGLALAGLLWQRSRRQRAEREAQERRRELLHATRISTMGELTASLAHELHQPLGAILRNAEAAELLMQANPPDLDEVQSILSDIRKDDARAAMVIDRMRGLLKRRDLESRGLAVVDLFDEVRRLVRGDARSHGVRLEVDVPAGLPRVMGDPVHLIQVLLNLVINAIDASKETPVEKRAVSMKAFQQNGCVEVAVSDAGHGVPAENLQRVFEPFHTTKMNGLGLGLSITRSIIEAHGGRVWAVNNPQQGATFSFTLPIEDGRVRT